MFDVADLAQIAASLACVGHSLCTAISDKLYRTLSPHLGEDLSGVSSSTSSTADEVINSSDSVDALKARLKEWGLPDTGVKSVLWQRASDEVI